MLRSGPEIGVVVPCYNEAKRLRVSQFVDFWERDSEIGFVFVNDGSLDNTDEVLGYLAKDRERQVEVVNLPSNQGKAEAVRAGIKHALSRSSCNLVGYWDADLSTPLDEIPRFMEVLQELPAVQFVCGSRIRRMGAVIKRFWYRHYVGRIFATAASGVLGIPIYDTQCGAKMIKAELARKVFDEPFLSKWLFDVELLARTLALLGKEKARKAIFELPLENWEDKGDSTITLYQYFVRAPFDLVRICLHYRYAEGVEG
jgi:dolichyl-phosphate beta-glucosyltransferase